jgi:hypothetical protein
MKSIYCILFTIISGFIQAKNPDSIKVDKNYQLGKNEIYASYGFLSISSLISGLGRPSFDQDFPSTYFYNKNKYSVKSKEIPPVLGALNIGYKRYFLKNKICVTANFSFNQINAYYTYSVNDSLSFRIKDKVFCIMPGFEYHYFNRKLVQLYTGAQIGLLIYNQKYFGYNNEIKKHNEFSVAFQVDAFGIRVGKKIGGFAEIGFGNAGIVKVGISGRF